MCAVWDVSSLDGGHFEIFLSPRLPPRFLIKIFKILADPDEISAREIREGYLLGVWPGISTVSAAWPQKLSR